MNQANINIVKEFKRLIDHIKVQVDLSPSTSTRTTNLFRLQMITKALEIIKNYPQEIKSGKDLKDIKGIGQGTIDRIDEILKIGYLKEIKVSKKDANISKYVDNLLKVHGIGLATAYELVTKHGIKTVEELKKAHSNGLELNDIILMGLKYYDIYKENIPREEVTQIEYFLKNNANKINKNLEVTICGSYRRNKITSNDIDVLLTHPDFKSKKNIKINYLVLFVKKLKELGFIVDDLTDKDYEVKYMGYCKLNDNPIRRIDIRYVPKESYYTALLYFTGSMKLNKKMRQLAESLGYLLNEYGLYKIKNDKKYRIKIRSEKEVFDILGMEYLEPDKRG